MTELIVVLTALLVAYFIGVGVLAGVRALRWERQRQRIQAESLVAEARLQTMTHQAMQQMHAVAREALRRQQG